MKLICCADDFAISDAVTEGILKCARDGILTQTGLFSNMPGSKYAVMRLKSEAPHICLGQDINLVAGRPVTDPSLIPSLVQSNGMFKTSSMHKKLDKENPHHVTYDDAYLETENQVKRFIELVGHIPDYLQGHSYESYEIKKAYQDIAQKYCITLASDVYTSLGMPSAKPFFPWIGADVSNKFDLNDQLSLNIIQLFKEGKMKHLEEALKNNGITRIHTHAGFVDEDLFRRSTYTIVRAKEVEFLCSYEIKTWVKENHVELVSIRDLIANGL